MQKGAGQGPLLWESGRQSQGTAALKKWLADKDDLLAGRTPRSNSGGLTVEDLCDHFLSAKEPLVASRELTQRMYDEYFAACEPAGLSYIGSRSSLSPDGGWQARGYEKHRGFGDLGWDNREKEYGGFIDVTERATGKTRTWRVSKAQLDSPAVAFSPNGTKLAGIVKQPDGDSNLIFWALPK